MLHLKNKSPVISAMGPLYALLSDVSEPFPSEKTYQEIHVKGSIATSCIQMVIER